MLSLNFTSCSRSPGKLPRPPHQHFLHWPIHPSLLDPDAWMPRLHQPISRPKAIQPTTTHNGVKSLACSRVLQIILCLALSANNIVNAHPDKSNQNDLNSSRMSCSRGRSQLHFLEPLGVRAKRLVSLRRRLHYVELAILRAHQNKYTNYSHCPTCVGLLGRSGSAESLKRLSFGTVPFLLQI